MRISKARSATLLLGFVLSLSSAFAATIFVNNASFETLPGGGLPNGCGTGCFYSEDVIPGWTNSGFSGQFQPGTQDGTFTYFNTLSDGITSAYSNDATISQTVTDTVQLGVVYTLLVDVGCRNDQGCFGSPDLLINGNVYLATGTFAAPGNWSTFTATYTGLAADVGDAITIELQTDGVQGNFDNVRLSDNVPTSGTPEPSFTGILGLGLIGLLLLSRHQG
jgi:hypothetical protein